MTTYVKLTEKGCAGVNKANKERNLDVPDLVFEKDHDIFVHIVSGSRHTNPKTTKSAKERDYSEVVKANPRSAEENAFDSLISKPTASSVEHLLNCLLHRKNPTKASYRYSHVVTLGFQENILS